MTTKCVHPGFTNRLLILSVANIELFLLVDKSLYSHNLSVLFCTATLRRKQVLILLQFMIFLFFSIYITAVHSTGDLTASSATVTRKIPVKLTYSWAGQGRQEKLEIECSKIQAPQCTNCMAKVTAQPVDMKHWEAEVEFGQEGAQNHATLEGRLENAGKHCYLEARWTKVIELPYFLP